MNIDPAAILALLSESVTRIGELERKVEALQADNDLLRSAAPSAAGTAGT